MSSFGLCESGRAWAEDIGPLRPPRYSNYTGELHYKHFTVWYK